MVKVMVQTVSLSFFIYLLFPERRHVIYTGKEKLEPSEKKDRSFPLKEWFY